MLPEWLSKLPDEWALLSGAPITSVMILISVVGVVWLILHFLYKHQLATKDETNAHLKNRADYPATEQAIPRAVPSCPTAVQPDNCIDNRRTFCQYLSQNREWIVRVYFARSGGPAHLRLDFSYRPSGIGARWTQPRKLPMKTISEFVRGQNISIPVLKAQNGFWYWATEGGGVILPSCIIAASYC
jgi:hypothetical protein